MDSKAKSRLPPAEADSKAKSPAAESGGPSPHDLKRVVLEYLSHHTYLSTAQALSRGRRPPRPAENGASSFPSDPNGEDVSMAIDDDDTRSEEDEEDDGADQMMASVMMAEPSSGPRPVAVAAVGALSAPSSSGPKGREASSTTGWTHEPGDLNEEQLLDIERRREIKLQILQGRIGSAISLINLHFPNVFNDPPTAASSSNSSTSTATPNGNGTSTSPPSPSRTKTLKPRPSSTSPSSNPHPTSTARVPESATSLLPSHLHLNLLIQQFIETVRTIPISPPQTPSLQPHSAAVPPPAAAASGNPSLSLSVSQTSSPASSTNSLTSTVSVNTSSALSQAPRLYALVGALADSEAREWYRKELVGISSLLAYSPPENGPTRVYLEQARRTALAAQVNSALMVHTGHAPSPTLDSLTRQLTFVWDRLARAKAETVPPWHDREAEHSRLSDYLERRQDEQGRAGSGWSLRSYLDMVDQ